MYYNYYLQIPLSNSALPLMSFKLIEMCITLNLMFQMKKKSVIMLVENLYVRSSLMAIVIFALAVTISEIFTVEMCMTLNFKMGQGQM